MPVRILLPPDILAMAHFTAQERPRNIPHSKPSDDPYADLVGALGEYAFAFHCGLPYTAIQHVAVQQPDGSWGDGGWDFAFKDGKVLVDIKASRKHTDSFVVPGRQKKRGGWHEGLKADWYVSAFVTLPDTVEFRYKAHRDVLLPMTNSPLIPGKRLVYGTEVQAFNAQDFKTSIPRRPAHHQRPHDDQARHRMGKIEGVRDMQK